MKIPSASMGTLIVGLAAACLPEIPDHDPGRVVEAEFDPSAEPSPAIPSPTDLVFDTTTGHLNVEVDIWDSGISWDLSRYFNALDGWPASMAATCGFLGEIDPATVNPDTVRVLDITDLDEPVEVEDALLIVEEDGRELRVHPGALPTWEVGRRYAIAVLGGEHGVRGASGEEVVPSSTFWFFRSDLPLADCVECAPGTHDADGDPWNGCELECERETDVEEACGDGRDNDCDSRTDDEDPDCSDCFPELCNGRDDDCDLEIDEDFDLHTDPLNCGTCSNVCPERPHSSRTCVGGYCSHECDAGCSDEDADPSNGCEEGCGPGDEVGDLPGSCRSRTSLIDDEDVADLEQVRLENAEVFDALEAAGIVRDEIALAWSFRTSSRVVVPFDPTIDDVHFPNDAFLSEDETHVELDPPEGSTPESDAFLERLNALDGFSLTAAGWMRFVGPLDGSSTNLTSTALIAANADDSDHPPRMHRHWDATRNEVVIAPGAALNSGTRYASLATKYLMDEEGERIIGSHIWHILASVHPVVDAEGRSNISSTSDEDAADLEEARLDYEELFETLGERLALPRDYYALGVVYTTRSVVEQMQDLRQQPYESGLGTAASAPLGVQTPADAVPAGFPTSHLLGVVEGTIPGLDLLDPETGEIDGDAGRTMELAFVLALPLAPPAGRSLAPVVVLQHDLTGSRHDMFAVADALAAEGYASVGIDLVGHGARGTCLEDGDCNEVFVPVENPFAAGDVLRQQAVDLVTLVRALRATDGPDSIAGVEIDAGDVSFLGSGFGAMAGAIFMAVDPAVHVAVLAGAGGNLGHLVSHSPAFSASFDAWLEEDLGLEPGSDAYRIMRYGWSWAADQGEPGVFARHLIDLPLDDPDGTGDMPPRALLVQIPMADALIPYESHEFFFFSAGTTIYPELFDGAGHGFLLDVDDEQGEAARAQAVEFIASGGGS